MRRRVNDLTEDDSVLVAEAMRIATSGAGGGGLGVIDFVGNRREGPEVSEDGFQVGIGHVAIEVPRHRGVNRSTAGMAGSNDLDELLFVMAADASRIGGEI